MSNYAVEIEDLLVTYQNFKLSIPELKLEKGYVYGLVGKNGAGKTTLLKTLVNLTRHINDKVLLLGKVLVDNEIEIKNKIGYVNDEFIYPMGMTARQLANDIGCFYENFDIAYFNTLLKRFSIDSNAIFKTLSKGNKHKVMIAFTLAYYPELILLDEPTADIDPVARHDILDLLFETMEKGNTTILFSTHITSDLDRIADYIIFIDKGQIVFNNSKDRLEEEFKLVSLEEVDESMKPYLKGIKKTDNGFEALCIRSSLFESNMNYCFKRANIEEILVYLGLDYE